MVVKKLMNPIYDKSEYNKTDKDFVGQTLTKEKKPENIILSLKI